ncbi:hypothetical protein [Aeoliella mucimassa]|uniref:Frag1/DRAM/Sfk1 family protein n=1 Tax=Aeoliella mucimassa TaxID=2527972 RepID=A0A518AIM3_9BACT|nr:hypothetical protein [Aeoliella mucimassa]QDU54514.1 hypothetical protein Pan181_06960 [Aeoliella mucimassa]
MDDSLNPFAAPQTDNSDRPQAEWNQSQPQAMARVRLGLTLVYAGLCCSVLAVLGLVVFAMMGLEDANGNFAPDQAPYWIPALGVLLVAILFFAGEVLCLSVPRETGSQQLVVISLVLQGVAILALVVPVLLRGFGMDSWFWWGIGANLAGALSLLFFLLFIHRVAVYISQRDIATKAVFSMVLGAISCLIFYGSVISIYLVETGRLELGVFTSGWAAAFAALCMLIAWVMYANSVTYLRQAISA